MKKTNLLSLFTIGLISFGWSQTKDLGNPISWNGKLSEKDVPTEVMPGYDQSVIDAEDAINDQNKASVWRFGYKYSTQFDLQNSGHWNTLPNGDRIWRLGIECEGALTVNLLLENLYIPNGAHLYLYDEDKTNKVGAYTSRNNKNDQLLGTELVHGEKIFVEYYEPSEVQNQGSFTITDVVHGYRSLNVVQDKLLKALNSSGDCNIDVECPLGNGWDDQIRSVAMIVVNGNGACTGALINNTCDDGTPYFLTADHCLGAGGGTGNWAFRFNWNSPAGTESCATTAGSTNPGPPYDETANGATTLANSGNSDFALLQITNMTVNDAQNWNAFYAGWDNTDNETVTQATGIHHPSGDVKKICREDNAPYHDNAAGAQVWMIDAWEQGVTEPGSSGSPLFDQNGRIIGQLYGGTAACSGTSANGYDYYGRFGVSWNLGVSGYLAPGACGTPNTNDGWDPNTPSVVDDAGINNIDEPTGTLCAVSFDPVVVLENFGSNNLTSVTINYDVDGGANNTFNWTGNLAPGATTNVTLPTVTTTGGAHTFNTSTSQPNGNTDNNPGNDASSGNFSAINGGTPITLQIDTDCWGSEVDWEIQDGSGAVIQSGGPYDDVGGGETHIYNFCLAADCYDFIINDSYGDGMYGSQYGSCTVDGSYTITNDNTSTVLASIQAANSDYGNQEVNNFCISSPCGMTLTTNTTEEDCNGDNTGEITVNATGGNAPYSYDIGSGMQTNNTFNNLAQGSYSITVEDDNGCTETTNVTLGGPSQLNATANTTDETCAGSNDGNIEIIANGGTPNFSYDIGSGNQTSNEFNNLSDGTYSVTVTDANGCTTQLNNLSVNSGTGVTGSAIPTDVSCEGDVDGSIEVNTSNGTAPFSYDIGSGAQSSETFTGLAPGNYTIDIIDDNGCVGQVSATVGEPTAVSGTYTTTGDSGSGDGSIDLTPSGGTPGYTYSWSGPNGFTSTVQDPDNLETGGYTVVITDANGCTTTLTDIPVSSSSSIDEESISFSIYPNPTNGNVYIKTENLSSEFDVEVLDITGRIIETKKDIHNSVTIINLSDKASGTYFIKIFNETFKVTERIVRK